MVWGAISGMVQSLGDPYTVFLPPQQNKEAKEDLGGLFEGIGAQLGVNDKKIVVIAPLKGTPAESAGIKAGDWIVKVDGKETAGWTLPEAVSKIRGPKGTKVTLTIVHREEEKSVEVSVTRDKILVKSVESWVKDIKDIKEIKEINNLKGTVAYLRLLRFGDQTNAEWEKAVQEISNFNSPVGGQSPSSLNGLILDLRNNPGGYLQGAVFITSEFLKEGVIVKQENASGAHQTYSVSREGKFLRIPLVVLINKGSASASEIVAGALKERGRAKLVGETTFGKGSIQEAQDLKGDAGLHITNAKWLLPSGRSVNGTGIDPDVKIEDDTKTENIDEQLEKAVEVLVK
jgi:carboxyl-terminal processing protease